MTSQMNMSLTLSSSPLNPILNPKENKQSSKSTSHRMRYFVTILVKLARIDLSYDFNYEPNPTPFAVLD